MIRQPGKQRGAHAGSGKVRLARWGHAAHRRHRSHRSRRFLVAMAGATAVATAFSVGAFAYWTAPGGGTSAAGAATLSKPTSLAHGTLTASSVPLTWAHGNPATLTYHYVVSRCTGSGCTPTTAVASGGCSGSLSTQSCTDTTVAPNKTYEYAVVDVYDTWQSTRSTSLKVTTPKGTTVLTVTAPQSDRTNVAIPAVTVTATLSGGASVSGTISVKVFHQTSAPTTCTSGGTTVGSAITVAGNGGYHPTAAYTPTAVGNYWWYAAFSDSDGANTSASSTCGASMTETVVATPLRTMTYTAPGKDTVSIPAGVATVTYTIYGGGGAGGETDGAATGGAGGAAAEITGKITLSGNTGGVTLKVLVGGGGKTASAATGGAGGACGTSCTDPAKGGSGGSNTTSLSFASGGGGSGSLIETSTATVLVVAAGGGGGGTGVVKTGPGAGNYTGKAGGAAGIFSSNPATSPASTGTSGISAAGTATCTNSGGTGGGGGGGKTSGTSPYNATGGCKGLADTGGPGTHHKPGAHGQPTTAGAGPGAGGAGGNSSDGAPGGGGGGGWAGGGGAGGGAAGSGASGGGGASFYRPTATVASITYTTSASSSTHPTSGSYGLGGAAAANGKTGEAVISYTLPSPTVTGLSPSSGSTAGGTTVTVAGTNFASGATVKFGSTTVPSGTVTFRSASLLTVSAPAHAAGSVDVTVATSAGASTKSAADVYTYGTLPAPAVTGVSPRTGSTAGGTVVTISGSNFVSGATVSFGGTAGTSVTVDGSSTITATAPAHASGSVDVTVTTSAGTSATSSADLFTFDSPAPTVTSLSPSSGTTTGTTHVTITGTNFKRSSTVTFGSGNHGTNVVVHGSTSITVTSPAHAAGTVDVTVTTTLGTSATSATDIFTYGTLPAPTVVAVSPVTGSTAGGTVLTVTGTNFVAGATVSIGGTAGSSVVVDGSTTITAITPVHASGTVDVTVHTTAGTSSTSSADHFTFYAPPTVTGLSPASGSANTTTPGVVITGTNFTAGMTVHFGSAVASATWTSATKITATAPSHTTGTVDVTITDPDSLTSATSTADIFTYGSPTPTVTGVSPSSGPHGTTTAGVVITGTNFASSTTVHFGSVTASTVTVNSSTSITVTAPSQTRSTVDVTVTDPDARTSAKSSADIFIYKTPKPTVSSINPTSGTNGTTVTVTGVNFTPSVVVDFGTTASTSVTVLSSTSLTATAPPGSGKVAVKVVDTASFGGNSSTATHKFTYAITGIAALGSAYKYSHAGMGGASTFTTSGTYGPAAGTKVVVVLVVAHEGAKSTATTLSITGGPSSTWTKVTSKVFEAGPGDSSIVAAFWGKGSGGTTGSAITVTGKTISAAVVEAIVVTGATTTTPVERTATGVGASATASVTLAAPTTGDAQLVIVAAGNKTTVTFGTPSGFTLLQDDPGTFESEAGFYRLPATAAAGTVSSTLSASTTWGALGIELKADPPPDTGPGHLRPLEAGSSTTTSPAPRPPHPGRMPPAWDRPRISRRASPFRGSTAS